MPGSSKDFNARVILLKKETTEGTDAAPAVGADAFRVLNYTPTFLDAEQKVRNIDKAFYGASPTTLAAFKRGATFAMELAGGGAAGGTTAAPWARILEFCGFAAASVGASSVTQAPLTSGIASATHWAYIDDLLLKTIGMRGSVGFTFEDDEIPLLNFNMLGRPPLSLADQSAPSAAPTYTGYVDPVLASTENTTITYGGYAFGVRRLTMSDNATLELRSLINPQDRINYSGRSWSGQLVIQIPDITVANANPFDNIRAGTTKPAQVVHGTTPGNIVQVDMGKLQVTGNPEISEEQGKAMLTLPVTALPTNGNDEVLFTTK